MPMIQIDEDELNATREQAAQMIPWKHEAERLALALFKTDPNHPALRDEIWHELVEREQKKLETGNVYGPDNEAMNAIAREATP